MDFHSLSRKELQAICKKNKIPANITNVAMANALQSLEHVEGLDELLNSVELCGQHSPEKTANGTVDVPSTAARTSTRRTVKEPTSSQAVTQTRRTTRRTAQQVSGQENKCETVSNTPAVPTTRRRAAAGSAIRKMDTQMMNGEHDVGYEKSDMAKTPAISTRGRKAPAASARSKKVDTSASAQQVSAQENKCETVSNTPAVPTTRRRAAAGSAIRKMDTQMMNGEDDVGYERSDMAKTPAISTRGRKAPAASARSKKVDTSVQKVYSTRRSVKLLEENMGQLTLEAKGETEPIKVELEDEAETDAGLTSKNFDNGQTLSGSAKNNIANEEEHEDSANSDGNTDAITDDKTTVGKDMVLPNEPEKTNEMPQVQNQITAPEQDIYSNNPEKELKDDVKEEASDDSAGNENEIVYDQTIENDIEFSDEAEKTNEILQVGNQTEMIAQKDDVVLEIPAADGLTTETLEFKDIQKAENGEETVEEIGDDQSIKMDDLVDVKVIAAADFAESSILTDKSLSSVTSAENPESKTNSENLVDVNVIPEVEYSIPASNLPSPDQYPAAPTKEVTPHSPIASLTHSTSEQASANMPSRKSAIKDQMTLGEMPPIVSDNKENIQIISNKDDENQAKKDLKSLDASTLEDMSIRQLTKLLKEKLQITNNEPGNVKENAGKPRQALQAVPGNFMTGNENKLK